MMSSLIFLALVVAVSFAWEEVHIVQPLDLKGEFPSGISHKPAMFGVPSYATAITGPVVYATPGDRDGCAPLDSSLFPEFGEFIVMVDRGNCTFVTKVRNVQNAGGFAVIIVDNVEEWFLPYMADDGTGHDINIPSVLIGMDDGQRIKDSIDACPEGEAQVSCVVAQISWALPAPDARVEWTLWTSSNDPASREMKQSFGAVSESLGEHALFTPRYFILDGRLTGCTAESRPCGNQCTDDGRFCAVDPDHDLDAGISGLDVVEENLRQICLFDYLNNSDTESTNKWWEYTSLFVDQCCTPNDHITGVCTKENWSVECSESVMDSINIGDIDAIRSCVTDRKEDLLQEAIDYRHRDGIYFIPSLIINNSPFRGTLSCANPINSFTCGPLEAICAGYATGTAPDTCYGDMQCELGMKTDCAQNCGGSAVIDACGLCALPSSPLFNVSCAGCDGKPNSGISLDACGVCGGDGSFDACGLCFPANDPNRQDLANATCYTGGPMEFLTSQAGVIVEIVAAVALLIVCGVCLWTKHQQAQIARIDSVLSSYLPLESANEFAHSEDANLVPSALDSIN